MAKQSKGPVGKRLKKPTEEEMLLSKYKAKFQKGKDYDRFLREDIVGKGGKGMINMAKAMLASAGYHVEKKIKKKIKTLGLNKYGGKIKKKK